MITEDYVSFETAKLLKEKGFDGKCLAIYYPDGRLETFDTPFNYNIPGGTSDVISAPTLQMTMKWLREMKEIFIGIGCCDYPTLHKTMWIPEISTHDSVFPDSAIEYDSYEEACEAAIKYCLENLI